MSAGKPREINWSWESNDSDLLRGYMAVDGRLSLTELIALMADLAPGMSLDDIHVNWSTVVWSRPASVEELAEREQRRGKQRARTEAWERETVTRLAEKYGYRPPRKMR